MIQHKRVLAVIAARAGSKGLPGKNLRSLCGKPLIAWTIEQALSSPSITKTIVSTDGLQIAEISRQHGADVPFLRPDSLASDYATSADVMLHAMKYMADQGEEFDILLLLEPTSPLRRTGDIEHLLGVFLNDFDKFDSVISIAKTSIHPSHVKKIHGNYLERFSADIRVSSSGRRQDYEPAYFPFGGMYAVKTMSFRENPTFYGQTLGYYEIEECQAYEVDAYHDFLAVESIMSNLGFTGEGG